MNKLGYIARDSAFYDSRGNRIEFRDGSIISSMRYGASFNMDALHEAYATEVIKEAAPEFGWNLNDLGNNKYEYVKGYE